MTAQVLAFRDPGLCEERDAVRAALAELQTLINLDPVLGASPARVRFVHAPDGKTPITECMAPWEQVVPCLAYALLAYDFTFARHLFEVAGRPVPLARAAEIISCSAGLQGDLLQSAAKRLGMTADPISVFDAEALKTRFFPRTQESVTHLFRLRISAGPRQSDLRSSAALLISASGNRECLMDARVIDSLPIPTGLV